MRQEILAVEKIIQVFLSVLEPPEQLTPSEWARKYLIVPDGPYAGEAWNATLTPYLIEPLDKLGPSDPANKIVIRKSAQTGFTTLGIAWIGHTISQDPCVMAVVQPTYSALMDFTKEKLNTAIENTAKLKEKVYTQVSRSAQSSSIDIKRYPRGPLFCLTASSTRDLRSKTIKKVFKDEASEYPQDLDGQGSPHAMIEARYESFLASGEWKELNISTPIMKGECYIDQAFEAGDQRFWHVPCPECEKKFVFTFDRQYFRFHETFPYEAHYLAPCCGKKIENFEKNILVQKGEWIATASAPGKYPSYHFDALSSPFVPWDKIAERFLSAQDDPSKLKGFYNLTLGLAYELKTDTPDHHRLMERREDLPRRFVPQEGILLVGAADVQMRGIYVEILAVAPNRETFVVDVDFILGETSDPEHGAFAKLTEIYERSYQTASGVTRRVDAFGIDSGYRSNVVYAWVRNRPGTMALKGVPGWSKPAIGTPTLVDIDLGGGKIKGGTSVWAVGTWPLKATFYSDLSKEGIQAGAPINPPGYCHFGTWMDEVYFKQVTSEYLGEETFKGRKRKIWKLKFGAENHFLDCRIYNMALAEYLGLSRMTAQEWDVLRRRFSSESAPPQKVADLSHSAKIVKPETKSFPTQRAKKQWIPKKTGSWIKRDD